MESGYMRGEKRALCCSYTGFEIAGESEQADEESYSETTHRRDFSIPLTKMKNSQSSWKDKSLRDLGEEIFGDRGAIHLRGDFVQTPVDTAIQRHTHKGVGGGGLQLDPTPKLLTYLYT
jgi:hypothetical protein